KRRRRVNPEQLRALTAAFEQSDTPGWDMREALARQLDMSNREIQVWFQNRRAKVNR
ncbi:homeobox domain-containing protein, partial [Syncephalis pseudoplumigaleata]